MPPSVGALPGERGKGPLVRATTQREAAAILLIRTKKPASTVAPRAAQGGKSKGEGSGCCPVQWGGCLGGEATRPGSTFCPQHISSDPLIKACGYQNL